MRCIGPCVHGWRGKRAQLAAVFDKARAKRPGVLFFDELDTLAFARSKASSEHGRRHEHAVGRRFGLNRPGRFTRHVFVPPPDSFARARIVALKVEGVPPMSTTRSGRYNQNRGSAVLH